MKRYYTVKEAARLLGVSTNTIYTYLDSGKMASRRIGRGRFKIPYNQLAPYIQSEVPAGESQNNLQSPKISSNDSFAAPQSFRNQTDGRQENILTDSFAKKMLNQITIPSGLTAGGNNILYPDRSADSGYRVENSFWELFRGLILIGTGFIYLFTAQKTRQLSGTFFEECAEIFGLLTPPALILSGSLIVLNYFFPEKLKNHKNLLNVFALVVLSYFSLHALSSGLYSTFVFTGSLAIVSVIQLIQGLPDDEPWSTTFTAYAALASTLAAILVIINPAYFPLSTLTGIVSNHKGVFGILWFGLITVPLLYFLTAEGKKAKKLFTFFYFCWGLITLIFATELAAVAIWDVSYMAYLLAVFGFFNILYRNSGMSNLSNNRNFPGISFLWIATAIILGLGVVKNVNLQFKEEREKILEAGLSKNADTLKDELENARSLLVSYAGNAETVRVMDSQDPEANILKAKEIFEKGNITNRVLIYDKDGKVLGVYPRESIILGTNLSSREYFRRTKSGYKGIISDVHDTVTGVKTITVTEPVFKNNSFYGMIGYGVDLEKLSYFLQKETGEGSLVSAIDQNGVYVINTNLTDIGKKYLPPAQDSELGVQGKSSKDIKIYQQKLNNPDWTFFMQISAITYSVKSANINILLTVFIIINSAFSIFAGIAMIPRKKDTLTTESPSIPELSLGGT